MHTQLADLPVTLDIPEVTFREAEWGDIHVGYETYHRDVDTAPYMQGLPGDRCQCPHWGVVLKGTMRVAYADRVDNVATGETYYLEPGHLVSVTEGTELIEFSPSAPYAVTAEAVGANLMRLMAEQA